MNPAQGAGRIFVRHLRRFGVAALAAAALVLTGCTGDPGAAEPAYGSLPTYLPSASIQADSVLTGTTERPALTTEGDQVEIHLAGGASVRATVTGPEVPGEGLPYQGPSTTCTWKVTLDHATAAVPIHLADFSTIDHLGGTYTLSIAPGSVAVPTAVVPGQVVSFQVRARMQTGEGLMRWAPHNSLVASWDFEVEND